ncbi:MAG: DNA polymerase III subunit alpha [Bacteroidales bacterium]|jgi:DNA polymerase-3 subunit alpha|nr:DNA polymerase III subunit alpha [Bacteroidales bacterium]MDY0370413.1 DNA polymerase III subunit alpha [Bacteroidales bacterium]
MFLIFDTETTGLPLDKHAPLTDFANWPRMVQLAWQLHNDKGEYISSENFIIKPEGYTIPFNAARVHGITTDHALQHGISIKTVLEKFDADLAKADYIIGHNIEFDRNILGAEFLRNETTTTFLEKPQLDTCTELTASFCQIPGGRGGKFKFPTLDELYHKLFHESFSHAHNAMADVEATARCFFELLRLEVFPPDQHKLDTAFFKEFRINNPDTIRLAGLNIESNYSSVAPVVVDEAVQPKTDMPEKDAKMPATQSFSHLRIHSTFSILNSTIEIESLIKRAVAEQMPAIGLTDTANLMSAFTFIGAVNDHNKKERQAVKEGKKATASLLKAILGSELYVCRDHTNKTVKDNGYLIPFFAKNKQGYHNLSKLSSASFTQGFYYVPRVDKELIMNYKEHLIVTTGSLNGEVPSLLLNMGEQQAEQALIWWKEQFGDDLYIELNRHGLPEEEHLNEWLVSMAAKHHIKYFAANDVYYLDQAEADVQDYLICIRENAHKDDPIGKGYGYRSGLPNDEYYFKSSEQMHQLFADLPDAIQTVDEIVHKVEDFRLQRDILLPEFVIPEEFIDPEDTLDHGKRGENAYLRHLAYEGAGSIFGDLSEEIISRLDFELEVIANTGYPGYFLIVHDLIQAAREMGVWVGPGRGSVAGSLVAYCIGITKINPLKYGLLFERFLNPDRISMPDIDIDFDDEGRSKVIDYAVKKYGQNRVAQIITYGTLGTKSAIRDISRTLNADQDFVDRMVSATRNVKLGDITSLSDEKLYKKYKPEQIEVGRKLIEKSIEPTLEGKILKNAVAVEGLIRNTGVHACGHVIAPSDLREHVPVTISKESNLWTIQYDNSVAEKAGLLKIDFLGLKTLSLIKETIEIVKQRTGKVVDPDNIPWDDPKTFELFQKGETIGIFQYESVGMRKYLRELKPTTFTDLINMNALYRPGPMAYIPDYIKRKHGKEPVVYDLEDMREILEETYGITVFQEQVMLLSQKLAGFTKGLADTLRKAMGKKLHNLLADLYSQFIDGTKGKGYPEGALKKIWNDWMAFAEYAFNKSHATSYAYIAFQTAYLKANFPAEYMASVLNNSIGDIKQLTFFMEECKRMKINVLGPDINESEYKFAVNHKGEIRFGLGAIKNMGEAAAQSILEERRTNGHYQTVFNFLSRSNFKSLNKRNIEALTTAGAFDSFEGIHRAQFFYQEENENQTFLEKAIRFAIQQQEAKKSAQINLFGELMEQESMDPKFPVCEPWSKLKELQMEMDSIGFYLSAHPLDSFKVAIEYFTNTDLQYLIHNIAQLQGHEMRFAGQIVYVSHQVSQQGRPYGRFKIEDHNGALELSVFNEQYLKVKHLLENGIFVLITASIQPSYKDKTKMEPRLIDMQLLDTVVEKSHKKVILSLNVNNIGTDQIEQFIALIKQHSEGNHSYEVLLSDEERNMNCSLSAGNGKVNAATLLPQLDDLDWVKYGLK